MSLSPIFSIKRDFLGVVIEVESDFAMPRLRDMCSDEATFLLSTALTNLPLGDDEPFAFFEDDQEVLRAVEVGVSFDVLGVEISGDFLGKGDACFFFVPGKLFSFLDRII